MIINPLSGRGRGGVDVQGRAALAREVLAAHDYDCVVHLTGKPGDATDFAADAVASGAELVVAWGGDGTINEAARALVHQATTALGIVPAGSGNGLAADLRIPFAPRAALRVAATAPTLAIDAGQVDDCLFFNVAGVGIDAVIAARFAQRARHQRGFLAYAQLSAGELLRYRAQHYHLLIDDEAADHHALLVAFANGRQYGNRMLIAPGARLDDGLLEVVVVERLPLMTIAWRLPALFRGTLQPGRGVYMRAARRLRVRSTAAIPFHVDGEPRLGTDELIVQIHPGALRVRASRA